eukprot:5533379-Prymnesium_polylepis.1
MCIRDSRRVASPVGVRVTCGSDQLIRDRGLHVDRLQLHDRLAVEARVQPLGLVRAVDEERRHLSLVRVCAAR